MLHLAIGTLAGAGKLFQSLCKIAALPGQDGLFIILEEQFIHMGQLGGYTMPLGVGAQLGIKQSSQMFPERKHLALLPLADQLGEGGGVQLAGCLQKVPHHQQIAIILFLTHRGK